MSICFDLPSEIKESFLKRISQLTSREMSSWVDENIGYQAAFSPPTGSFYIRHGYDSYNGFVTGETIYLALRNEGHLGYVIQQLYYPCLAADTFLIADMTVEIREPTPFLYIHEEYPAAAMYLSIEIADEYLHWSS